VAAYTAYDVVGKKEDISDIISNISPTDTPFISAIGKESIHNTLYQWQEDSLAAPNTSNAAVQGADATETDPTPTVMRQNYTQILTKTLKVAETTDAVSRYGRAKETAYQLGKYSKELKRDKEAIWTSSQASAVGNSSTTPSKIAAYGAQVASANLVKTGGTSTPMSEANLLTALEKLYTAGVDPRVVLIPPAESINVASFASAAGRYRTIETSSGSNMKIVNAVNLYVSPFGEVKIALSRFHPATDHLIFDPSYWKDAVLRPWTRETLAKTGDAHKMMLIGEFGLIHRNQLASAIVRKAA
jgi:hypothetical protein